MKVKVEFTKEDADAATPFEPLTELLLGIAQAYLERALMLVEQGDRNAAAQHTVAADFITSHCARAAAAIDNGVVDAIQKRTAQTSKGMAN